MSVGRVLYCLFNPSHLPTILETSPASTSAIGRWKAAKSCGPLTPQSLNHTPPKQYQMAQNQSALQHTVSFRVSVYSMRCPMVWSNRTYRLAESISVLWPFMPFQSGVQEFEPAESVTRPLSDHMSLNGDKQQNLPDQFYQEFWSSNSGRPSIQVFESCDALQLDSVLSSWDGTTVAVEV